MKPASSTAAPLAAMSSPTPFATALASWQPQVSRCCAAGLMAMACLPAVAQSAGASAEQVATCADGSSRLTPYDPSYFTVQQPKGDEAAIRLSYSLKYRLWGCDRGSRHGGFISPDSLEAFFSFSGEFDFYMGTRPSSPVINRFSNPALHLRKYLSDKGPRAQDWVDIGLEHLSNGQTTGVKSPTAAAAAQAAYDANNHRFFDTISRSSDYLSLAAQKADVGPIDRVRVRLKFIRQQDSRITWGLLAGQNVNLSDYDRLRLTLAKDIGSGELAATWTVGDKGAKTDSVDVTYLLSRNIPFYVRYHSGPLHIMSNYTQPVNYVGLGVKFEP